MSKAQQGVGMSYGYGSAYEVDWEHDPRREDWEPDQPMRLCVCGHPYDEPYHDEINGLCAGCGCRRRVPADGGD